jgi:GT2 family glycosyltransferase
MSEQPSVSVVVLNWNGLQDTRECLQSLKGATYPAMRVIVVDNGSANEEAAAIRKEFVGFAEIIELPENLGFAGGANAGIRRALEGACEYVLLLNNDTVVDPGFLTAMVNAARDQGPAFAAACPTTYFYDRRDVIYSTGGSYSLWRGSAKQIGRGKRDSGRERAVAERGYADGVCMLISRKAIEDVGLLDEAYFNYWEETDWCARARRAGFRCYYVPKAKVWHKAARSQDPDPRFQYLYRRNALLFVRKRGNPLQFLTAVLTHLFFFGPLYLLKHPTKVGRIVPEIRALWWHASNRERQRPLV